MLRVALLVGGWNILKSADRIKRQVNFGQLPHVVVGAHKNRQVVFQRFYIGPITGRNAAQLVSRIADEVRAFGYEWIQCATEGAYPKTTVDIFSHREFASEFHARDPSDWMAQTFFTGGLMPSDDLLLHFQRDVSLSDHWRVSGPHYARTLRAWLAKLDQHHTEVRKVLVGVYGADQDTPWLVNWRLFFMVCEETWKLCQGNEYMVSPYLFDKR